nr:glycoside hydrolase family 3 C-terminal domain-containing protein [Brachybacterium muris]
MFGRIQKDWIAVGYGSGGDVNPPYVTNLLDSLRESGTVQVDAQLAERYEAWCAENPADPGEIWGQWPRHYPEMPLEDDAVREAAQRNEVAVVVIGRAAGEDRDAVLEPGSYYLTEDEKSLLSQVTAAFERTVVIIDAGNVIDMSWVEDYPISAVMIAWAGGMEGGRATADVLTGAAEPGGRLTDTIARRYEDYPSSGHFGDPEVTEYVEDVFVGYRYFETFAPEAVQFPFGFGLGYTTFETTAQVETVTGAEHAGDRLRVRATVTNAGDRPGSEVVQVYASAPDGALATPARELVAFARTEQLDPGASTEVTLEVPLADLASYDDAGVTGHRSAWVLEPGTYRLFVGPDVRRAEPAGETVVPELRVVAQLEEVAAVRPEAAFERMTLRREADGAATVAFEAVPTATVDLKQLILDRLPAAVDPSRTIRHRSRRSWTDPSSWTPSSRPSPRRTSQPSPTAM